MSKSLQYVKILDALRAAGAPLSVDQIKAIPDIVPTRLSTYLWEIKKFSGYAVKSIRSGRTVVSYELVGSGIAPTPVVAVAAPVVVAKPAAPKKAPKKVSKPVVVVAAPVVDIEDDAIVVEKNDRIVDILDEMDTDVTSFEDREFAEDFVKGL